MADNEQNKTQGAAPDNATAQASDLDQLRDTYRQVAKTIDMTGEPTQQLMQLADALNSAIEKDRCATDADFATFLYEDMAPGLAKRMEKERSNDQNYLKVCGDVMENLVRMFSHELRNKRYSYSFYSAMTLLFNYEASIHRFHYQIPKPELQRLRTMGQEWRKELGLNDMVDVLVQADETSRNTGWLQGKIVGVNEDTLQIEYPKSPIFYDGKISRWATELQRFESKTKADYEWREKTFVEGLKDFECDIHDKQGWYKSTIFELKMESKQSNRPVLMAYFGLRVYREPTKNLTVERKDARGTYEGWSDRFDAWIPVFSPRVMPFGFKVGAGVEEQDLEDNLDDQVSAQSEFERVYAVPRLNTCISALYLRYINIFGNEGGFHTIINLLKDGSEDTEGLNIQIMGCLAQIVTLPYAVLHKKFIEEQGPGIAAAIKDRLVKTSDKALRDVRKEQVDAIIRSVDNISKRFLKKEQRTKQTEVLRLDLCNKSLVSEYLERRIQGIRDLSTLVKNNSIMSNTNTFTTDFLIEWMLKNDVFATIWDPRKTHLQIVQRTNEIFKLLVKDDKMDLDLMKLFWSLAKSDHTYQVEVFKIISEANHHMKLSHIEFFFNELTQQPAEKFTMAEFDCLCDLGKYCRDPDFKTKVDDFFWVVIINASNYSENLVDTCIKKYAEMVRSQPLDRKKQIFQNLVTELQKGGTVVSILRLFSKLLKDHKSPPKATTSSVTTYGPSKPTATYTTVNPDGSVMTSYSYAPQDQSGSTDSKATEPNADELAFKSTLNQLEQQLSLMQTVLESLSSYCIQVKAAQIASDSEPKTVFVACKNYSHADEICERLQFLKYFASQCDFQFRKAQLRVIYDSLANESPLAHDNTEFLLWCKQACQETTADSVVLDLNEVGEYFSELMLSKALQVETLPVAGFEFLQNYFLSVNENQSKLLKQEKKQKAQAVEIQKSFTWQNWSYDKKSEPAQNAEELEQDFVVQILPSNLERLDLVWLVVQKSRDPVVAQKSVDFLIKVYMSLNDELAAKRADITQELIAECIAKLQQPDIAVAEIERLTMILRTVIQHSEKKGGGGVQPHSAILKGELLDRIVIKNNTRAHAPNLVVKVWTSATVWEFIDKTSRLIGLAPQFVEFRLKTTQLIDEADYGKTLGELGFKNYDVVSINKLNFEDAVVTPQSLIDPATNKFVDRAYQIFSEWYDLYSDEDGVMTPESTTRFILGATNEMISPEDSRIKGLFDGYDQNKDGRLEREEFITFYEDASKSKAERVYENMANHFIRKDLVKLSELYEEQQFAKEQMPRYTLSHNQQQFDTLLGLLERQDESSPGVYQLIRMLATNQKLYQQVLQLDIGEGWQQFLESGSRQKQSYQHEIIEALMEDAEDLATRVFFVEFSDATANYKKKSTAQEGTQSQSSVKQTWSTQFLQKGGLKYLLKSYLQAKSSSLMEDKFQVQNLKFTVSLLNLYISCAINANPSKMVTESLKHHKIESQVDLKQQTLIELLQGQEGAKLLEAIDFEGLSDTALEFLKVLTVEKTEDHSIEQKSIVVNTLSLWTHCQLHNAPMFRAWLQSNQSEAEKLVMSGLLYCGEERIRQEFQVTLLRLAHSLWESNETGSVHGFLLKLLSKNFHEISQHPCRQFFDLFNELTDMHFRKQQEGVAEKDLFDAEDLLGKIIDKIRADKKESSDSKAKDEVDEITAQQQAQDKENLMIGLVLLTGKIIAKVDKELSEKIVREKDLINEIFKEFLFASVFNKNQNQVVNPDQSLLDVIKSRAPRKVKLTTQGKQVNKSREAAYQLLNELIRKSPVIMNNFIREQLKPLLDMIKKPKQWNYTPPSTSDRIQKYVGLRNLGCICYMNSMMQQFFMIPAFRYNLLCVDDGVAPDMQEHRNEIIDDNMMHQMQRLFAHLDLSERQDYNPLGFTFSFKEFDGRPTNTSEQKDAQEFLNVLFDRVERALKPTPRKYLLQSVFGGKTCSQLICPSPECGKIKNRIEDYYNLSLTVKDIDSVENSLKKMIEGEVISDFRCEGCNKKVDITKRNMITETPNVLIIHLQRLLFDFDTCMNEKMNQHFEFPTHLNLKPYSYHEVMASENKPKREKTEEELKQADETGDEEKKEVPAEEDAEPEDDDCFEYKLVGVNVHSGSANAGHYWSYINTVRGMDEKDPKDPTWQATDKDQWMEFNDSQVKDYKFENLKDECFGDKQTQSQSSAWGGYGGGAYGKSAYMLFYERRIKKPIKIIVEADQAGKDGVFKDEKNDEHFKLIDYKMGVDSEKPNSIFQKVLEDNTKFTFENDVYSQEFFNFLKTILQNVASFGDSDHTVNQQMRQQAIEMARKAAFDILARCFYNSGIKDLIQIMIQIFQQDTKLVSSFLQAFVNEPEPLLEVLLDCTDSTARNSVGDLFKFLVCQLKMQEKEALLSDKFKETVSSQFIEVLSKELLVRAAKNSTRFENFLELFQFFAFYSPEQVVVKIQAATSKVADWSSDCEAAHVGIEAMFKIGMLEKLLDFILGDKSPLNTQGQVRVSMGGMYNQPNFTSIMKVCTEMFGHPLLKKYPQSEECQKMMYHKEIIGKIIDEHQQSKDFASQLSLMCKDNEQMTKKLAKIFFAQINQTSSDKVIAALKSVKKFLLIDDGLKRMRLEYLLGYPQLMTKNPYRQSKYQYGVELVDRINDDAYRYTSVLCQSMADDCLLNLLLKQIGRQDNFCIKAVKDLMSLCLKDAEIAEYMYRMAPHTYQYARYTDWFGNYINGQREEMEKMSGYAYYQERIQRTNKAVVMFGNFETCLEKYQLLDAQAMFTRVQEPEFDEIRKSWMYEHDEVVKHFPPQFIVGQQVGEESSVVLQYEDDFVKVELREIQSEFMYSNPTKFFNLSLPEKLMRTKNYTYMSYQNFKSYRAALETGKAIVQGTEAVEQPLELRNWQEFHQKGNVVLQVLAKSKVSGSLKVQVSVDIKPEEGLTANVVNLPISPLKESIYSGDARAMAHFLKAEPNKDWNGKWSVNVKTSGSGTQTQKETASAALPLRHQNNIAVTGHSIGTGPSNEGAFECMTCKATNYQGMQFCEKCGESLAEAGYYDDYNM